MTISEILDRIYKRAKELGFDLESMGIYDDEDIQVRALTLFYNSLEDLDEEMVSVNSDEDDGLELEEFLS